MATTVAGLMSELQRLGLGSLATIVQDLLTEVQQKGVELQPVDERLFELERGQYSPEVQADAEPMVKVLMERLTRGIDVQRAIDHLPRAGEGWSNLLMDELNDMANSHHDVAFFITDIEETLQNVVNATNTAGLQDCTTGVQSVVRRNLMAALGILTEFSRPPGSAIKGVEGVIEERRIQENKRPEGTTPASLAQKWESSEELGRLDERMLAIASDALLAMADDNSRVNSALETLQELKREGETASSQLATTLRADYRIFRDQRTVMTKRWKALLKLAKREMQLYEELKGEYYEFQELMKKMSTLTVLGKQVLNASQTSLEDRQPVPGIKAATIRQMVQEDIQRQIAVRQRGKEVIESAHSVRVMFVALDKMRSTWYIQRLESLESIEARYLKAIAAADQLRYLVQTALSRAIELVTRRRNEYATSRRDLMDVFESAAFAALQNLQFLRVKATCSYLLHKMRYLSEDAEEGAGSTIESDFEREKQIAAARMEKYHDKLTWAEESRQKALELFEEVGGNMDKLPLREWDQQLETETSKFLSRFVGALGLPSEPAASDDATSENDSVDILEGTGLKGEAIDKSLFQRLDTAIHSDSETARRLLRSNTLAQELVDGVAEFNEANTGDYRSYGDNDGDDDDDDEDGVDDDDDTR